MEKSTTQHMEHGSLAQEKKISSSVWEQFFEQEQKVIDFFIQKIELWKQEKDKEHHGQSVKNIDVEQLHEYLTDIFVSALINQSEKEHSEQSKSNTGNLTSEGTSTVPPIKQEEPDVLSWMRQWSGLQKKHWDIKSRHEQTVLVHKYQTKNAWKMFVYERIEALLKEHNVSQIEHVNILTKAPNRDSTMSVWMERQKHLLSNRWVTWCANAWLLLLPDGPMRKKKHDHFGQLIERHTLTLEQLKINAQTKDQGPGVLSLMHELEQNKTAHFTLPKKALNPVMLYILIDMLLGQCIKKTHPKAKTEEPKIPSESLHNDVPASEEHMFKNSILNQALDAILLHELGHLLYRKTLRDNRIDQCVHSHKKDPSNHNMDERQAVCTQDLLVQALGPHAAPEDQNGTFNSLLNSIDQRLIDAKLKIKTLLHAVPQALVGAMGLQALGLNASIGGAIGSFASLSALWIYHWHKLNEKKIQVWGVSKHSQKIEECVCDGISIALSGKGKSDQERKEYLGLFEGLRRHQKEQNIHDTRTALQLWSLVCESPQAQKCWDSLDNKQCIQWSMYIAQSAVLLDSMQDPHFNLPIEPSKTWLLDLERQIPCVYLHIKEQLNLYALKKHSNEQVGASVQECKEDIEQIGTVLVSLIRIKKKMKEKHFEKLGALSYDSPKSSTKKLEL